MPDNVQRALTSYIVCTALEFTRQQGGKEFARQMILDAGIDMANEWDRVVIEQISLDHVKLVNDVNRGFYDHDEE
ncbi:hypothetical protein ValSw41_23 [Vibrio phage ValSw4_1]|nr:hypothetical protein ValSw41_23 [Vibrio phage ValSw4_1]